MLKEMEKVWKKLQNNQDVTDKDLEELKNALQEKEKLEIIEKDALDALINPLPTGGTHLGALEQVFAWS